MSVPSRSVGQRVQIAPIGGFAPDLLGAVADMVARIFGLDVRTAPLIDEIGFAYDTERKQYHSTAILDHLSAAAPADCFKVLAVTREDLFIPILTHVYGEAQLGGSCCVVSTQRLGEGLSKVTDRSAYLERVAKEAAHELGHTFDLRHCRDASCLMHYCRNVSDVDRKRADLCRYCQVMMGDHLTKAAKQRTGRPLEPQLDRIQCR
ncbi:MAG: archaemetzincin family Zn-dependent metalloprotease [Desulfosarcinaceae bacterium]|nr:archaemetzincin family Zn-dependent metalloprotease [Desulfosarcinaceae bacterium]